MNEARAAGKTVDPNEKKIVISHLKKSFDDHEVLSDINLEVNNGEVVCIIGPSGSGKSTLLRCINRLEDPTDGTIIVDGCDITDKKANLNKIRENIGMVFQQFNLFHNHTVLKNITLAPIDRKKYTRQQAHDRALELLARVGLSEKAASYPGELSGGQQQRVAI
ncbi:MAG: amino acid ABC transporter ATP-binding protein, partial [Clostridia bacterium]|nr:amino acid ABC transporter ATP-binding protein [Clostridia bacterium]